MRVVRAAAVHRWRTIFFVVGVLLVAGGAAWAVTVAQTAQDAANEAKRTTASLNRNRVALANASCTRSNRLTHGFNKQSKYLEGLIVAGAVSTRAFERQLRALGFPPYQERLRRARAQASGLRALEVASQDCAALVESIRRSVQQ